MSNTKINGIVVGSVALVVAVTATWVHGIQTENGKSMFLVVGLIPTLITLAGLVTVDLPIRATFGKPQWGGRNYVRPTQSMWAMAVIVSSVFAGCAAVLITLAHTLTSILPTVLHVPCLIVAGVSATFALIFAKHAVRIKAVRHMLYPSI